MDNMSSLSSCVTPLEISISSVVVNDGDYNLSSESVNGSFTDATANVLAELESCGDYVDVSYLTSEQFLTSKDAELCSDSMDLIIDKTPDETKFSYQDPLLNQGNVTELTETVVKSVNRPTECDPLKDDYIDFSLLTMIGYGLDCNETLEPMMQEKQTDDCKLSVEIKPRPLILRAARYNTSSTATSTDRNALERATNSGKTDETKSVIIRSLSNPCILNTSMLYKLKRVAVGEKSNLIADISSETEAARNIIKINIKTARGDEVLRKPISETKFAVGSYYIVRVISATNVECKRRCVKAHHHTEFDDEFINTVLKKYSITDEILFCIITGSSLHLWICPYMNCGRAVYKLHALKRHLVIHFGIKPFKCDFPKCKWSFYTSFRLKRHQDTHLKIKMFKCPEENCERTFTTVYNLRCHRKLHDRPANIKCLVESCKMYFQTLKGRETHLQTHEREDAPYKCKFKGCEKVYFSFNSLTAHSRAHSHKESDLKCSWENCGRMFDQPCRLREHMRQHTGDKPYACDHKGCKWAFPSASKLRRHQNTHRKERPYHCTIGDCTKAFFRSEHLKEHTLTHIAQRTFQCEICDAKFSSKSSTYMHHKKAHPGLCQQTTLTSYLKSSDFMEQELIEGTMSNQEETLCIDNISAVLMNDKDVFIRIPDVVNFNIDITEVGGKHIRKAKFIRSPAPIRTEEQMSDIILQRAIESLGVASDVMLTGNQDSMLSNSQDGMLTESQDSILAVSQDGILTDSQDGMLTELLLTEETEFDESTNLTQLLEVTDNNYSESTINLRDLE